MAKQKSSTDKELKELRSVVNELSSRIKKFEDELTALNHRVDANRNGIKRYVENDKQTKSDKKSVKKS